MGLEDIVSCGSDLPPRVFMYGQEGFGKTTIAAASPDPVFIMTRGEDGLETLITAKRLMEVPHFPECETHLEVIERLNQLAEEDHNYKTVVIDTYNGLEDMVHKSVCFSQFGGNWYDFVDYGRGAKAAGPVIREIHNCLYELRRKKRVMIVLLSHETVKEYKNAEGQNYAKIQAAISPATLDQVKRWADVSIRLKYKTTVDKDKKAVGEKHRYMSTEATGAFDAKSRVSAPQEVKLKNTLKEMWPQVKSYMGQLYNNFNTEESD